MIRALRKKDFDTVVNIVNENWKSIYAGYVNPNLLNTAGCRDRAIALKNDFNRQRLLEYVWEENNHILALLSIGNTADLDKLGDFEIWRIYIVSEAQGKGIGKQLLTYAESYAKEKGYTEIVIWAFKNNKRAIMFYQRYGYQIDKEEYLGEPYLTYGVRLLKSI